MKKKEDFVLAVCQKECKRIRHLPFVTKKLQKSVQFSPKADDKLRTFFMPYSNYRQKARFYNDPVLSAVSSDWR